MSHLHYFAYGSNMSVPRLQQRIVEAERLGVARLERYRLALHKAGERDGSAKCDIVAAPDEIVLGVLFRLPIRDLPTLDAIEGPGYDRRAVTVHLQDGHAIEAETYLATVTDPKLRPYTWYKHHVLVGARESGLPASYLNRIERIAAIPDPDLAREHRELSIYR